MELSFGLRGVLVAADYGLFSTGNYVEKVSFFVFVVRVAWDRLFDGE